MMTKKTMTIISVFMVVALTAVGFAAWLIVGTIDADTQGSFVANELKDKYFSVSVDFKNDGAVEADQGKIAFGIPTSGEVTDTDWLTYNANDTKEKLSATATIRFIPDDGFSKKEGEEVRDMAYYLLNAEEDNYRTIRVKINIDEIFSENGDRTSDNYKWYDWAVELGYLQHPTAKVVDKEGADVSNGALEWANFSAGEPSKVESGYTFENNSLYIDLDKDDFVIQYADGEVTAKEAVAYIKIEFQWGEKLKSGTDYLNPYAYFNGVKPDGEENGKVNVDKYLKVEENGGNVTYSLAETSAVGESDSNPLDNNVIRNKDLAQRMLDYLKDHLNCEFDEDGNLISGIQFSITLSEGKLIPNS